MSFLLDTSVAIPMRDGDHDAIMRLRSLSTKPAISIISLIELERGVVAKPALRSLRRQRLDALLDRIVVIDFNAPVAAIYRTIIEAKGFSRRTILDRLIAATAIAHDLALITANPADFRDIPGLELEIWPAPSTQ